MQIVFLYTSSLAHLHEVSAHPEVFWPQRAKSWQITIFLEPDCQGQNRTLKVVTGCSACTQPPSTPLTSIQLNVNVTWNHKVSRRKCMKLRFSIGE